MPGIRGASALLLVLASMGAGSLWLLGSCAGPASGDCGSNSNCPQGSDAAGDSTTEGDALRAEGGTDAGSESDVADAVVDTAVDSGLDAADGFDGFDGFRCDPTKSPHDEPCVIDEAFGVFVAPAASGGSDALGNGTRAAPYATLGKAIATLNGKSRVYVCDATYAEHVLVSSPVSLYGGLACPNGDAGTPWSYVGGQAQIAGPQNQIALSIDSVASAVVLEDFAVSSPNASGQDPGGNGVSSIAALVNSSAVTFRRCAFTAGSATSGKDGPAGSNYPTTAATAPDGTANDGGIGGSGGSTMCNNGATSTGGAGGSAGLDGGASGGDGAAYPMVLVTAPFDGLGGSGGLATCVPGDPGANGAAGDGGSAATVYGTLTANGWTPSAGGTAAAGAPGQGGGGGGGKSAPLLGGTGGGSGGCGGAGGSGGAGGGASIALACIASTVALDACVLTTSSGGSGGRGGDGQPGQGGGTPGTPASVAGCAGAYGGNGAGGCGGAGGTGGISVCIVYSGTLPVGSPNFTMGDAGTPGSGGSAGDGGANALGTGAAGRGGAAGLPGVAQATLQIP